MYDYIIVGAGAAGCVLANRLSAGANTRIALIEAGPTDNNPLIHMPVGIAFLANNKKVNWAYNTEPQTHLNGRRLFWPRGKILGGSSSINAMIYIRGRRADYEAWEQASGSAAWGWDRMKALFKRMENNHGFGETDHHGAGGELSVSALQTVNPLSRSFVQAGRELQIPFNDDFNGVSQEGIGPYQVTQKKGRRWSSAKAFLTDALHRPNLDIFTDTRVTRIVFRGKQATGVECHAKDGGRQLRLKEGGEVLLSGGVVNSPQLLMLSGVGPGAELKAHGIPLVHDLAEVGRNVQDHLSITLMNAANSRRPIGFALSFLPRAVAGLLSYMFQRKGFLTSSVAEAGGFVKSSPELEQPNLQLHFLPTYVKDHGRTIMPGYGYTLNICGLSPKSRGYIGLKSAKPFDAPLIDPNYLDDPQDLEALIAGVKIGRRIFAASAMAAHCEEEVAPGPRVQSVEQLADDIRNRAESIYHPVGSCRMGKDAGSVVDPELKVRGVSGLRIIDASIMPQIVSGNTSASTMVIAENAADLILRRTKI